MAANGDAGYDWAAHPQFSSLKTERVSRRTPLSA
jgi:hypothetical protein